MAVAFKSQCIIFRFLANGQVGLIKEITYSRHCVYHMPFLLGVLALNNLRLVPTSNLPCCIDMAKFQGIGRRSKTKA